MGQNPAMRLLVFGGRYYWDRRRVFGALDAVHAKHGITQVIHGKCPTGADKLADEWAKARGVPIRDFPADWDAYGKAAGPRRNQQMVDEGQPDNAVGFPGDKGTRDMASRLIAAGIKPWQPYG